MHAYGYRGRAAVMVAVALPSSEVKNNGGQRGSIFGLGTDIHVLCYIRMEDKDKVCSLSMVDIAGP